MTSVPINPQERLFPSQPARFWNALDTHQPFLKHSSLKFRLPNIQDSIFQTFQMPFVPIFFLIFPGSLWVLICSVLYGPYFSIHPENVSIFLVLSRIYGKEPLCTNSLGKLFYPKDFKTHLWTTGCTSSLISRLIDSSTVLPRCLILNSASSNWNHYHLQSCFSTYLPYLSKPSALRQKLKNCSLFILIYCSLCVSHL